MQPKLHLKKYRKYFVSKADGSELDPSAFYFVIRYDRDASHGECGRQALLAYVRSIYHMKVKNLYPLALDLCEDLLNHYTHESKLNEIRDLMRDIKSLN